MIHGAFFFPELGFGCVEIECPRARIMLKGDTGNCFLIEVCLVTCAIILNTATLSLSDREFSVNIKRFCEV